MSATVDSAGNPSRGVLHDRLSLLAALSALMESSTVSLLLDKHLIALPDPRPGRDPKWHQQIRTSFALNVDGPSGRFEVNGNLLAFATRGDSAAIPPDQVTRGARPDFTSWWLDRLEDETLGGVALPATRSRAGRSR